MRSKFPRARKRFGQHFLEPAWVMRLLEAMAPAQDDTFLEIGPGRGALTVPLAGRVARLIAIEIDRDLAAALPARLPSHARIVEGDFLDADVDSLLREERQPLRVVGNLPYNVSTPILFRLLHLANDGRRFRDATLMLQKEVADRLVAPVGSAEYGTLAVQVAMLADVDRLLTLPPGAFRPPPRVTSAVVRLRFRPPAEEVPSIELFERLVRGMFLQRRKTILNALSPVAHSLQRTAAEVIERAGVDPRKRPQELTVANIAALTRAVL